MKPSCTTLRAPSTLGKFPRPPIRKRPILTRQNYCEDQYDKAIEAIKSLSRQVRLHDADYAKRSMSLNRLDDAIAQLASKLPRPTMRPVPRIEKPAPKVESIEASITPTPRTASSIGLNVVSPHKWTRWVTDESHKPFVYTHRIMPGLFRILATDGIRAIVIPNDQANPPTLIVHVTNLELYIPFEKPQAPKPRVRKQAPAVEYSIEDLI